MLRFAALAILFAAVCAVPINDETKSDDLGVMVVDSNDEYLAENPNVQLPALFVKGKIQYRNNFRYSMYSIGNVTRDDHYIGHYSHRKQYLKPQNVTVTFHYPTSGAGSIVTFLQIVVLKNSKVDQGRAYVTAGGIGQRKITVAIEASETTMMQYDVTVWGHN